MPDELERARGYWPHRLRRRRLIPACSGDREQVRAVERLLEKAGA